MQGPGDLSPRQRQSLRTRPRALLSLRHPPLPPAAETGAHETQPDPLRWIHAPAAAPFRGGHRYLPGDTSTRRPQRRHLQRAGPGLPPAGFPDASRSGAAQRAVGARQPVDVPHRTSGRSAVARASGAAGNDTIRPLSYPARGDACTHGPQPQRVERHLLPGHGFPRGRAGAQRLHRSGGAWTRPGAKAAGRSVLPRHR